MSSPSRQPMMNVKKRVLIALGFTLSAVLTTSCGGISVRVGSPRIEAWFAADDLVGKRIAVAPHIVPVDLEFDHQGFDVRIYDSVHDHLGESVVLLLDVLSTDIGSRLVAARGMECDYVVILTLEDLRMEQNESTSSETNSGGKIIITTTYRSTTTVEARLKIYRVSDGAVAFEVFGQGRESDEDWEDDEDGDFPGWLIKALFFSAGFPPLPDPGEIASELVDGLVEVIPQGERR